MKEFINRFGLFTFSVVLFIVSVGMFFYQKNTTQNLIKNNQIEVLIATKEINSGSSLNEENVGWKAVDKDLVSENNITKNSKVEDKGVRLKILKGDFVNVERLEKGDSQVNKVNRYYIDIVPDFSLDLAKGDLIKVYTQIVDKDGEINNRLVFNKKEILAIVKSEDSYNGNTSTLKVEVTDKDSLLYYNAKQQGKIIVLKYSEDINNPDVNIPYIKVNETFIINEDETISLGELINSMPKVNTEEEGQW